MGTVYDAVLFDLDGTLLDTAGDLVAAVNVLLEKHRKPMLPISRLRPWVSQGGLTLVSIAFEIPRECAQAEELWQQYLVEYAARSSEQTVLFDGLESVLDKIEKSGRPWGIVTNKPEFLTIPLLQNIGLSDRTNCIVGGDTVSRGKPWPDPVLYACDLLKVNPHNTLIIGDDIRDIQAGQAAGLTTIAAAWGYIRPDDDPHAWGADAVIEQPDQLYEWID